ncbi:MAG: hypothetical protein ABJN35_09180 [Erythrobacter sp.]
MGQTQSLQSHGSLIASRFWLAGANLRPAVLDRQLATAICIVLIAILIRAPYLGDPAADPDEQLYSVMGQAWLVGDMPYRDIWDRKPPGLFALFAGFHWIGGPSPLAYQIPGIVATAVSALMIHKLAQKIGTPFGAVVVALLFLLNIPLFFMHLGQSETFLGPILLLQLIWIRRVFSSDDRAKVFRSLCAIMALGGAALQIKYSVLPFCALLAVLAAVRLWQMRFGFMLTAASLMFFSILGLLPTILFAAYFASQGEFEAFFFANFISIFLRSEFYPLLAETNIHKLSTAAFPLGAFALLSTVTAHRMRARIDVPLFLLIAAFTAVGAFSLVMLGSPFVHYFGLTLPFICLMSASFFSYHRSHRIFGGVALLLALACASFAEQIEHSSSHRAAVTALVADIEAHVPADECIFIFDGPTILYASANRCIPTKFAFSPHLTSHHERSALNVDPASETARIMAEEPGAILVTDAFKTGQFLPETRDLVHAGIVSGYVLADTVDYYPGSVELYIRADLAPPQRSNGDANTTRPCAIRYGRPCEIFVSFAD